MTAARLITLDLLVAVMAAAAWLGAGTAAAAGRTRSALALFAGAVLATLARVASVVALAGSGWWFVQEKVTLALPLLGVAAAAAVPLAGARLVRAARSVNPADREGAAGAPVVVVPLLTAGYAATAGVTVTLLVGYPVGWAEALITVALVGGAALLTWRIVAPDRSRPRQRAGAAALAVGLGGAGLAGVGLAGVGLAFVPAEPVDAGGGPPSRHRAGHGVPVTALRGEPGGGPVRRYTLTAGTGTVRLSSGRQVEAWTFNGRVPGPPITATEGDLIEVTLRNAGIKAGVTLHWHGYDVPAGEDGAPGLTQRAVPVGQEFRYRFRADQVGTYWYHTHQASHRGVRMGLFGTLVVTPRRAASAGLDLTLPVHTFAGTTVLGDHDGPDERRLAPGTPGRLRLVNTDSTTHRLALAGTRYRVVAVDGSDLHRPGPVAGVALALPAGGRYDLAFTMPPAGPVVLLVDGNRAGGLRLRPGRAAAPVVAPDTTAWPDLDLTRYGVPAATPFGGRSRFDRNFTLVLDRGLALSDGAPRYAYTVNGRAAGSIPVQLVREHDLVRMTVVNRGLVSHPWHLHGHRVLVLSRDGRAPAGSPLWLDSFEVRPGEVWQVAFRAANPGLWMNHCHNLPHADQGMALHLAYEGVTQAFHGVHGAG